MLYITLYYTYYMIGDFVPRLRQHTLAQYEYIPIPKIHYKQLENELYVHEYYLRNICDEQRFPDYYIATPLVFLRELIERWKVEVSKGVVDSTIGMYNILMCM